jgi:Alpha 1,4-glycosyltransferase conserved region
MVLLQRYGGIALDSSIISFRPLHCLRNALTYTEEKNLETREVLDFASVENNQMKTKSVLFTRVDQKVANQFISFDSGHPFLNRSLESVFNNFTNLTEFELKGTVLKFCSLAELSPGKHSCPGGVIDILDADRFHIQQSINIRSYFFDRIRDFTLQSMAGRFLAYVPGAELGIAAPPASLYSSLARSYCPKTWAAVETLNLPF